MANILLIETATQVCSVGVCTPEGLVAIKESHDQKSHAEWITTFIHDVLKEASLSFEKIDAVAVSKGPGSYTGLRIGVSTAKGICYALDKPLIAIDTLEALAYGMKNQMQHGPARGHAANAHAQQHDAHMLHTGIGQHAFIVALIDDKHSRQPHGNQPE